MEEREKTINGKDLRLLPRNFILTKIKDTKLVLEQTNDMRAEFHSLVT